MFAISNLAGARGRPRDKDEVGARSTLESLRSRLRARTRDEEAALFERIAEQVAQRRSDWGLSQSELAELCGTTQSAIARIERGARPPRIDTLWRVANALDCELEVELRPRTELPTEAMSQKERRHR